MLIKNSRENNKKKEVLLTERQLERVQGLAERTGTPVRELLQELGYITKEQLRPYTGVTETEKEASEEAEPVTEEERRIWERIEGAPAVRLVNTLIEEAYWSNASDIHVEPGREGAAIRMRVDGELALHSTLRPEYCGLVTARLKLMGGMDIAEKRIPQDGKYHYEKNGAVTDLRISSLPTIYGEKVVLRLLGNDRDRELMQIENLGMEPEQQACFERLLRSSGGMILVTGPTGSGKTTTLYAALTRLSQGRIHVVTVEDPVEKAIEGASQVQIHPKAGLTFASALRAIMRQDPDVIMIGEMRDEETAAIGVRAAVTGHLVLATLHTGDSVSAVDRLHNLGVPRYMTAAALRGVVSQRLVRFQKNGVSAGRKAVYEILEVDEAFREKIASGASAGELREALRRQGFRTMGERIRQMREAGEINQEEEERMTT